MTTEHPPARLEVDSLEKRYGTHAAVDRLTFSVQAGELACLIGPNGAGKSTTMRILGGLQLADAGAVRVDGAAVPDAATAKRLCGLTPQELDVFEYLSGVESLRLVATLRGVAGVEEAAAAWLGRVGLAAVGDRLVRHYSGGMKRRLAVAMALLPSPPVVVLDESFTGLDPESTAALGRELRAYCDRGGAVLLSSHILDHVAQIADRVVVMRAGRCVGDHTRAELAALIPSRYATLTELYLDRTGASLAGDA
ncbi:MAG: ABC transporter ATP-binding protein [Myxococcales bacterium]|nr:ABC transporter ATP-binding protein [Myxococcales bacterium]MCB9521604.1 ABC transporter ATP-binding protein [Myxococcales bacterium]MCB9532410.1 ABC transporter ATP-binding protein [Myxococcales bacterium]